MTVEKWESLEALQAHLGSPHVAAVMARAGELLAEAPRIIATEPLAAGDPAKNTY